MSDNKDKQVVLKKWSAIALWSVNSISDTCAICRESLQEPCPHCQREGVKEGSGCQPKFGVCNHAFHTHCILRWLKEKNTCPMCNEIWNYQ